MGKVTLREPSEFALAFEFIKIVIPSQQHLVSVINDPNDQNSFEDRRPNCPERRALPPVRQEFFCRQILEVSKKRKIGGKGEKDHIAKREQRE